MGLKVRELYKAHILKSAERFVTVMGYTNFASSSRPFFLIQGYNF